MGHEDAFPTTTLSIRSRLGKPTFAGTRGNEQDAPTTVIRRVQKDRLGSIRANSRRHLACGLLNHSKRRVSVCICSEASLI